MMKTKKEIIQQVLEANKDEILLLEIREAFLQRRNIVNKNTQTMLELGTVQQQLKDTKEWVKYLEEIK